MSDNLGVNVAYAAMFNGEQDVYFLRIGLYDCNANEVADEDDIGNGTSYDCNANDVPDECEYRGDFNGDGLTDLHDLAAFQRCFGGEDAGLLDLCCALFDLDPDSDVDLTDFAAFRTLLTGP